MNSALTARTLAASVATGAALVLTTCSSSTGGASASQTQIENKLKKESEFASAKTQIGTAKFDKLISCVAKVLKKDASGSDLDDYVSGKKQLTAVKGNEGSAKTGTAACVKSVVSK